MKQARYGGRSKYYCWFLTGVIFMVMAIFETVRCFSLMYPELLEKYDASAAITGWLVGTLSLLRLGLAPVATRLCRRFSIRRVMMVGGLLAFIGYTSSGFVNSLGWMFVTYAGLIGVGYSLIYAPSILILASYFERGRKGLAFGLAFSGNGFGSILFPPIYTYLHAQYGLSGTLIIFGAISLNLVPLGMLCVEPPKEQSVDCTGQTEPTQQSLMCEKSPTKPNELSTEYKKQTEPTNELTEQQLEEHCETKTLEQGEQIECKMELENYQKAMVNSDLEIEDQHNVELKQHKVAFKNQSFGLKFKHQVYKYLKLFKYFGVVVIITSTLLFQIASWSGHAFIGALFQQNGLSGAQTSFIISIGGITEVAGIIITGLLFDIKWIKNNSIGCFCFINILLGIVSFSLAYCYLYLTLCICYCFWAFLFSVNSVKNNILSDNVRSDEFGDAVGLVLFTMGLGAAVGPVFTGMFVDLFGSYIYPFVIPGSLLIITFTAFFFIQFYRRLRSTHKNRNL